MHSDELDERAVAAQVRRELRVSLLRGGLVENDRRAPDVDRARGAPERVRSIVDEMDAAWADPVVPARR